MTTVASAPVHRATVVRGLAWVTWRQHRLAMLATLGLLGGIGTVLLINGLAMHTDYHRLGLDSCADLNGAACRSALDEFMHRYQGVAQFLPRVITFIPALLGAFLGAPLVARELESGTFRFAWTQGTNRTRWSVAKLLLVGTALVILTLAFSALFTWWFRPWIPIMGRMESGQAYEIEGTVFAARTAFGFALGALLGAVIRRTVAAMAATLAIWLAVVVPSVIYLRPAIQQPVTVPADSNLVTSYGWTIHEWIQDRAGHHASASQINALLNATNPASTNGGGSLEDRLARHGLSEWVQYQPGSRFWHFQQVETLGYVVLTVALGVAAVCWVRRHAA